jgi:serine/threonine protein kinase
MSEWLGLGDVLAGKYRVERILGSGGMGVVVAARHLQLDVLVALKMMTREAGQDPELVSRFLREGRAAARLRSEHVARVTDVGTLESGAPYQVMEYLEGCDLHDLLATRGPLPIPFAVEYIVQACEALDEAHSAGIVHRDIKPSNLFLTTQPSGMPCVKVLDFGVSKSVPLGPPSNGMHGTLTRALLGTPFYMAPEQLRASRDVDARADLWALGATLYELLTGRVPFNARSLLDLVFLVTQTEPVPPRVIRADIPRALERIVLRCLEKKPEARPRTAHDLASMLAPFASRRHGPPDMRAPGKHPDATGVDTISAPRLNGGVAPVVPGSPRGGDEGTPDRGGRPRTSPAPRASARSRNGKVAWALTTIALLAAGGAAAVFVMRSAYPRDVQELVPIRAALPPVLPVLPLLPGDAGDGAAPEADAGIPTISVSELPEAPRPERQDILATPPRPAAALPSSPPVATNADCRPPVYVDEHGRTKFKEACLDTPLFVDDGGRAAPARAASSP